MRLSVLQRLCETPLSLLDIARAVMRFSECNEGIDQNKTVHLLPDRPGSLVGLQRARRFCLIAVDVSKTG